MFMNVQIVFRNEHHAGLACLLHINAEGLVIKRFWTEQGELKRCKVGNFFSYALLRDFDLLLTGQAHKSLYFRTSFT